MIIFIPNEVGKILKLDGFCVYFKNKNSQEKTVPKASRDLMANGYISLQKKEVFVSGVKIFYGSQTGKAKVRTYNDTFHWVS